VAALKESNSGTEVIKGDDTILSDYII
jgi:hypothetical protein